MRTLRGAWGALLPALLALPVVAAAQEPEAGPESESPLVETVRFEGDSALLEEELRVSVVTQETRCRGVFLLRPLCAVTDWSAVVEHEYLDREEIPRDELRLEVLYFRRGYRDAAVRSEIVPTEKGVEVVFHVSEGPPTVVRSLDVVQTEPLLANDDVLRARLPSAGEPLDLIRLQAGLFELTERMRAAGHLDGTAVDSIALSEDELGAELEVVLDPGPRSTLGALDIAGNEAVSEKVIGDALRLRTGRVLTSRDLVASERSLYESNLFHEARVTLAPQQDSAKTLVIEVREAPPQAAEAGGGFSTVEFFQLEARYTHYNWTREGRRLTLVGAVGNLFAGSLNGKGIFHDVIPATLPEEEAAPFLRPTWQASGEVMQPGFLAADNRVGIGVFGHRRSLPGIVIDQGFGATVSLTRRIDFEAPISAEYRYESSSIEAGDLYFCGAFGVCDSGSISVMRGRHRLSPLGVAYFSDQADDPLSPREGYRLRLELEHASALTFSQFRHNRVHAEAAGYLPLDLFRTRILAGRLRAGWVGPLSGTAEALGVDAEGLSLVHPRRRFYAGGARSVRGFGENQLGPKILTVAPGVLLQGEHACTQAQVSDASCDPNFFPVDSFTARPVGGSAVIEASVEYRFPFLGPFQGAAFVDGAIVGTGLGSLLSEGMGAITPGVGIRWHTPVVPIRVDLGFRPALREMVPVLTEVVDADGTRRLVRLSEPRLYDPVRQSPGGFFQRMFAHFRLHVWIGEAY